jgi:hypothetical protein
MKARNTAMPIIVTKPTTAPARVLVRIGGAELSP